MTGAANADLKSDLQKAAASQATMTGAQRLHAMSHKAFFLEQAAGVQFDRSESSVFEREEQASPCRERMAFVGRDSHGIQRS
jgi:hypothetical protein